MGYEENKTLPNLRNFKTTLKKKEQGKFETMIFKRAEFFLAGMREQ